MAPIIKLTKKTNFSLDRGMLKGLGIDQIEVYWNTNIDITKLASGVACSYKCILVSYGGYVISKCNKEEWSTSNISSRLLNIAEKNYNTIKKRL